MTYEFNSDWVTSHEQDWRVIFAELVGLPQLRFLEIGSYEGRSTIWWLDNVLTDPTSKITCVDPWAWGVDKELRFDRNIVATGRSDQVRKIKSESARAITRLGENSFDAAYVDGSHEAADTLLDGLLTMRLLKVGGILLFDDYGWAGKNSNRHHLPGLGIDAFLKLRDYQIEVVHKKYQVAIKKLR